MAEILEIFAATGRQPLRFTAYDGSTAGQRRRRARAWISGRPAAPPTWPPPPANSVWPARTSRVTCEAYGVHPGDPYELLKALTDRVEFKRPSARVLANVVRSIGIEHLLPIAPPPQETPPRWRRIADGVLHSKTRDAEAIHHHYDVSNTFYEWVLGPSMTYTCAVYPDRRRDAGRGPGEQVPADLREAAAAAGRPAARRRLRLGRHGALRRATRRPGDRRHAVGRAGEVGATSDRGRRARGAGRGAALRLPRRARDGIRRRLVDRADRAHRRQELPRLLRLPQVEVAHRRPAAQSLHHPPRQQIDLLCRRIHRPLRLPGRGADRLGPHHHRHPGRRFRGAARGELPASLRDDAARLVPQPGRALGRRRSPRSGCPPPRCGACTWRRHGWPSSTTTFSCITCWRPTSTQWGDDSLPLRPWWQP